MAPSCLRVVIDDRIAWTIATSSSGEGGEDDDADDAKTAKTTTATMTTTSTTLPFSSTLTASAFIKSRPAGAYTTARTSARGTRVFDLGGHIERLASSAALLGGVDGGRERPPPPLPPPPRALRDASLLGPLVRSSLRLGLLKEGNGGVAAPDPALGDHGEFRVTILATWTGGEAQERGRGREGRDDNDDEEGGGGKAFSLSLHVAPLPPPPSQPVSALILEEQEEAGEDELPVASHGRHRAAAKSTSWVSERAALEAAAEEAGAEEVLLVEREGNRTKRTLILEGLSSNFAAVVPVRSGSRAAAAAAAARFGEGFELQTAAEGRVLAGTVRALLLDVASGAGFSVRDSCCPAVEEARSSSWVGCLLLSTSRLALPVAELLEAKKERGKKKSQWTETSLVASFRGGDGSFHPVVERLSREVAAAIEGASESIL